MATSAKTTKRPQGQRKAKAKVGLAAGAKGNDVIEVQGYLKRFGYLAESAVGAIDLDSPLITDARPVAAAGEFDSETEAALRQFQVMAGLEPTGTLTAETAAKMSAPRLR